MRGPAGLTSVTVGAGAGAAAGAAVAAGGDPFHPVSDSAAAASAMPHTAARAARRGHRIDGGGYGSEASIMVVITLSSRFTIPNGLTNPDGFRPHADPLNGPTP